MKEIWKRHAAGRTHGAFKLPRDVPPLVYMLNTYRINKRSNWKIQCGNKSDSVHSHRRFNAYQMIGCFWVNVTAAVDKLTPQSLPAKSSCFVYPTHSRRSSSTFGIDWGSMVLYSKCAVNNTSVYTLLWFWLCFKCCSWCSPKNWCLQNKIKYFLHRSSLVFKVSTNMMSSTNVTIKSLSKDSRRNVQRRTYKGPPYHRKLFSNANLLFKWCLHYLGIMSRINSWHCACWPTHWQGNVAV